VRFQSQPFSVADGIMFSLRHDGRVRNAFVSAALIAATPMATMSPADRLKFVAANAQAFLATARAAASGLPPSAVIRLDTIDSQALDFSSHQSDSVLDSSGAVAARSAPDQRD
jgi:hypothetical protein